MPEWLFRNLISMLLMIVLARWVARPRLGKVGLVDVLFVNTIGDLTSHSVFEMQHPYLPGIASVALWICMAAAGSFLAGRSAWFHRLYHGRPHLVISDGKPDAATLKQLGVHPAELESELRKQGVTSLSEVKTATVEPDGSVAVITKDKTADELRTLAQALIQLADQLAGQQR